MNEIYLRSHTYFSALPHGLSFYLLRLVILIFVVGLIIESIHSLLTRYFPKSNELVRYKLDFPFQASPEPISNDKLFLILHNLLLSKSRQWLNPSNRLSLEFQFSKSAGIELYVFMPKHLSESFETIISSAFPGVRLNCSSTWQKETVLEVINFRSVKSRQVNVSKNTDGLPLLLGQSGKLIPGQYVYQLILSPGSTSYYFKGLLTKLAGIFSRSIGHILLGDGMTKRRPQIKEPDSIFSGTLRVGIQSNPNPDPSLRSSLISSISASTLSGQKLIDRNNFFTSAHYSRLFNLRLPSFLKLSSLSLSIEEVGFLFPLNQFQQYASGNTLHNLAPHFTLPLKLKQRKKGTTIGLHIEGSEKTKIRIKEDERLRHILITGATGSGKTTLISQLMMQDVRSGNGICFIDPHGDASEELISQLPPYRQKDLIYINPADIAKTERFNPLELDHSLSGDQLKLQAELVIDSAISSFNKTFGNESQAANRLEYILRNAIKTSFYTKNPTLATVYRLLNDKVYRQKVLLSVPDPVLKNFWQAEFDQAGQMQRVKLSFGVTSKLGRLVNSSITRNVIASSLPTVSFNEAINQNRIIICNLSKGLIGEDNSSLIGSLILAKLQQSIYARQALSASKRSPLYLYVDEFQNFATESFVQMLSESRKYGLSVTMAEQSLSQQRDTRLTNIILANIGSLISFRVSSPADENVLLPLLANVGQGILPNLPSFQFLMRLNALDSFMPFSGQTVLNVSKTDRRNPVVKDSVRASANV